MIRRKSGEAGKKFKFDTIAVSNNTKQKITSKLEKNDVDIFYSLAYFKSMTITFSRRAKSIIGMISIWRDES